MFFFVSGFWSGHPIEGGRDPFAPYIGKLGKLRLEGMFLFFLFFLFFFFYTMFLSFAYNRLTLLFLSFFIAVKRLSLSKFHRDRVHKARLYTDRSFHSLVTLQHLATWGLNPEPSVEAIAHKLTVHRREFSFLLRIYLSII